MNRLSFGDIDELARLREPGAIHCLTLQPLDDVRLTDRIPSDDRQSVSRAINDVVN